MFLVIVCQSSPISKRKVLESFEEICMGGFPVEKRNFWQVHYIFTPSDNLFRTIRSCLWVPQCFAIDRRLKRFSFNIIYSSFNKLKILLHNSLSWKLNNDVNTI